ncbi:hypothetical protein BU26DRAFT_523354 [Trematosphaeria pertusa]|uniref:Uncharacterized protein n=1 Tax=Trematosphaeria pertusa TaxID=390896 RepID=A0A6A6HZU9_9PLEO|nr:uncharacterized protein BU26DRAFT_523354 [Trematosphaeria pertusa]KAF2243764.1 hypothetical protein BU26DRAFT_523354 [Trematosphaeria pertusa]
MPASTRSSNKDANFKVYYSKKVPKQKYFPHRKKTVRRPSAEQDEPQKKQMKFLPEKMRRSAAVRDSDEEETDTEMKVEEDLEDGGVAIPPELEQKGKRTPKTAARRGKKRSSDMMQEDSEEDDEPVRPTPKRRRESATTKKRRPPVAAEPESEDEQTASPSESEREQDTKHRLRRQSTMTQIVGGRRPEPGSKEPQFKPAKRSPRTSWGGKGSRNKGKDKQQRTLTQMVPGLIPLGIVSDDDAEELGDPDTEDEDNQAYNDAIVRRLAEQGLFQPGEGEGTNAEDLSHLVHLGLIPIEDEEAIVQHLAEHAIHSPLADEDHYAATGHFAYAGYGDDKDGDENANHQMQNVAVPTTKKTRASRRVSSQQKPELPATDGAEFVGRKHAKSRFGLLSTPEKRRIFEIASSQSPPESPLSTQNTPQRPDRAPLQERSGNATKVTGIPSKRKQVTFQEPHNEQKSPPSLRKFASVIRDSEDEEEDILDDEHPDPGQDVGRETQVLIRGMDNPMVGASIGEETQAMLHSIDQACANAEQDTAWTNRDSSEELGEPGIERTEESLELGDQQIPQEVGIEANGLEPQSPQYHSAHPSMTQEPSNEVDVTALLIHSSPPSSQKPQPSRSIGTDRESATATSRPSPIEHPNSTPPQDYMEPEDEDSDEPMFIGDDSSDDEEEPVPTPPQQSIASLRRDSEADQERPSDQEQAVQVPRSPSANPETQQSHSSKAEQQLQAEYQTYSQYRCGPLPSSMHVAPETGFSYQATPFPPRAPTQLQHSGHLSQATTVDPTQPSPKTTPSKSRSQPIVSANTTPHKIPNSQPFVSPHRPPPLFIPSSFPSPSKAGVGEWSSPVLGRKDNGYSQFGGSANMEDFSIPAPPPVEVDDDEL